MSDGTPTDTTFPASRALLSAALGGLLCLAPGCSSSGDHPGPAAIDSGSTPDTTVASDTATAPDTTSAADTAAPPSDTATSDVAPSTDTATLADGTSTDVSTTDASETTDAAPPDAAKDCAMEAGTITSSKPDPTMTLDAFTTLCDARGGTLELHSHCGGYNSCKGISYDTGTQVFTEHTCRGLNTCAGYSCVDPC